MGDPFIYDKITTEDVVFTRADDNIRKLTWRLNGEVFAAPLELEAYVEREGYLSQQALTKDGRCTYFVLAHKHDGTHIVASCESIKKTVFIAGRNTGINDGFVEATGYAIASVYTNPKYRRLGMAAYMLRRLQEQMDQESECSVLYSDIGRMYYANLGWDVFSSEQATIYLHAEEQFHLPANAKTTYIGLGDLPGLCDKDVAQMRAMFQRLAADRTKTHVAFAPDFAQISWQLAREDFVTRIMHAKPIVHRGAIAHNRRSWVYWDHDWRTKQLKILRLVMLEEDSDADGDAVSEESKAWDVVELLQAAAAEAAAWGLKKVLVWNPDATTTRGIKGFHNFHENEVDVIFDERKDTAIPSLRWKGARETGRTVWEDNHCYAWC
ncbi:unnamed protein product [Discula destructiva]